MSIRRKALLSATTLPTEITLYKDGVRERKPVSTLAKELKITWSEDLTISSDVPIPEINIKLLNQEEKLWQDRKRTNPKILDEDQLTNYLTHVQAHTDKLALLDMNKPGDEIGYGIIAEEEIKEGSFITHYSGILELEQSSYSLATEVTTSLEPEGSKGGLHVEKGQAFVNGAETGNIARFLQSLPTQAELRGLELPDVNPSEIATANLKVQGLVKQGIRITGFVANREIQPKELVGFSYGPSYWHDNPFWLFKKNGERLVKVKYNADNRLVLAAPAKKKTPSSSPDRFFKAAPVESKYPAATPAPKESGWTAFKKRFGL